MNAPAASPESKTAQNTAAPNSAAQRAAWEASSLNWLYLDLNSYFASVEQQENPRLRGKPVMVVPVMSETTSAIAASYEAKAFGIKTGTPVWEAKRLCPGIVMVDARHDVYVDYHHRILEEVDRHIPVYKSWSIDEVSCELMGPQKLEPEARALANRIKAGLRQNLGECIRCSIGIAPNQFLAKLASDMQKPDGLTVIHRHELPERILPLPLRDLPGIGPNMERRLNDAGIGSIEQLWALDPRQAREIWGSKEGPAFCARLRGYGDYHQSSEHRSVSHEHVLPPQFRDAESAFLVVRRLCTKAGSRLRRMGYLASGFYLKARFENGERWAADFRLTQTQDNFILLDAAERLWQAMLKETGPRRGRFRKVGIALHGLVPEQQVTLDLFSGGSGHERSPEQAAARAKLSAVMDRLNGKFGKDTVHIGALPGHRADFMGAKIAFNRIPDAKEFIE